MRPPAPTLIVDAAVLIAAVRGRSSGILTNLARSRTLSTTDRVVSEVRRRIEFGMKAPKLLPIVDRLLADVSVVSVTSLEHLLPSSEAALKDAVSSRNASTNDAHVLALAWSVDADIWSGDRDFAGTGVASWSTINLIVALAESGGPALG